MDIPKVEIAKFCIEIFHWKGSGKIHLETYHYSFSYSNIIHIFPSHSKSTTITCLLRNTKSKLKILDSSTIGEQSQLVYSAEEKCGIFAHSRTRTVCRVVISLTYIFANSKSPVVRYIRFRNILLKWKNTKILGRTRLTIKCVRYIVCMKRF